MPAKDPPGFRGQGHSVPGNAKGPMEMLVCARTRCCSQPAFLAQNTTLPCIQRRKTKVTLIPQNLPHDNIETGPYLLHGRGHSLGELRWDHQCIPKILLCPLTTAVEFC